MTDPSRHVDVLIIGAGLSGIGAACHLVRELPGKSYFVLESRAAIGGTWDLFRYPGVRSDSDMYTLGYGFKPWTAAKKIADGASIREYVEETAREYGITENVRFGHEVLSAEWSSVDGRWTVTARVADSGETTVFTCAWLSAATGYYRYDEGFRARFGGEERFTGPVVHPQHWPEDLDYTGKRVVVIGSGATAITLVPTMAEQAEHVTMVQRTPSYVVSMPAIDSVAGVVRRVLPGKLVYPVLRWKNMLALTFQYQISRRKPDMVRAKLRKETAKLLPNGYDVDTHFNPPYNPWDQRMCLVPDGDLFQALSSGTASISTGHIKTFTEDGLELESGERIPADIIVTATGLNLLWLGGMTVSVDGEKVDVSTRYAYKGAMISGLPNLSIVTGYTNASWTLKADLVSRYVTRMIGYLDDHGYVSATPVTPTDETPRPFLDLASGYIERGVGAMAKQGTKVPWRLHQNYMRDIRIFGSGQLQGEGMSFQRPSPAIVRDAGVSA